MTDGSPFDARPLPAGFPGDRPRPPIVAESRDPFASLLILEALARVDRGREVRLDDLVDRLNAAHLDWLFTRAVVADALVDLQANWIADYRSTTGILIEQRDRGAVLALEDTPRVDPWLVAQANRLAAECREVLRAFARRDTAYGGG